MLPLYKIDNAKINKFLLTPLRIDGDINHLNIFFVDMFGASYSYASIGMFLYALEEHDFPIIVNGYTLPSPYDKDDSVFSTLDTTNMYYKDICSEINKLLKQNKAIRLPYYFGAMGFKQRVNLPLRTPAIYMDVLISNDETTFFQKLKHSSDIRVSSPRETYRWMLSDADNQKNVAMISKLLKNG